MSIFSSVAKEECVLCGGALDVVTVNPCDVVLKCRECKMTVSKSKFEFFDNRNTEPILA